MYFYISDCVATCVTTSRCYKTKKKAIRGVLTVWSICQEAGVKVSHTRSLNQDLLENSFSIVRLHKRVHTNPSPHHFIDTSKTNMLNHPVTVHSPGRNCEGDEIDILENLKNFVGRHWRFFFCFFTTFLFRIKTTVKQSLMTV